MKSSRKSRLNTLLFPRDRRLTLNTSSTRLSSSLSRVERRLGTLPKQSSGLNTPRATHLHVRLSRKSNNAVIFCRVWRNGLSLFFLLSEVDESLDEFNSRLNVQAVIYYAWRYLIDRCIKIECFSKWKKGFDCFFFFFSFALCVAFLLKTKRGNCVSSTEKEHVSDVDDDNSTGNGFMRSTLLLKWHNV